MYTFVFKNGGWWLSVSDIKTLIDFHEKTENILFGDALNFHLDDKDQGHSTYGVSAMLDKAIVLFAESNNISYLDAASRMASQLFTSQADELQNGKTIYINSAGGWHIKSANEPSHSYIHSEKLVWPNLKEHHIHVSQFEGGTHWYARVGNIEVKDPSGNIKWNTYDEAYNYAKMLLQ